MARQKVIDLNADTVISFDEEGTKCEGWYLGYKQVKTKFVGGSRLHVFLTSAGNVGAWGSTQLDQKLDTIAAKAPGSYVWIEYLRKIDVPAGTMKTFDVDFDPDSRQDVSAMAINVSEEPTQADSAEAAPQSAAQGSDGAPDVDPSGEEAPAEDGEAEANPAAAPVTKGSAKVDPAQAKKADDLLNKFRKPAAAPAAAAPSASAAQAPKPTQAPKPAAPKAPVPPKAA